MIIVLDGYDGSGKTTIAQQLAGEIGGQYIKSYKDSLGKLIWSLLDGCEYDLASLVAYTACRKEEELNSSSKYIIFDRHWLTLFTLLPEPFHQQWLPLPETFLIKADTDVVIKRLHSRDEKVNVPASVHLEQQKKFENIADQYNIPKIDTTDTSADECVRMITGQLDFD